VGRPRIALVATLLFVLSPPVLGLSYAFFTEVPSALLLLCCWRGLDRVHSPLRGLAWGALAGLLLLFHIRNLGLVVGLLIVAALRLRSQPRTLAGCLAGVGAMTGVRTALTWYFWGTLLTTPLATPGAWAGWTALLSEAGTRAIGLLVDQEHGLLVHAPLYALVPAGAWLLRRRFPRLWTEAAVLCSCYLVPVLLPTVNAHGWRGGWAPAARFLVPLAPVLFLLALEAAVVVGRSRTVITLVVVQGMIDVLLWGQPMLLWNQGTGGAAFLDALGGPGLARLFPSVGTGASPWPTVAFFSAWTGLTVWLLRGARTAEAAFTAEALDIEETPQANGRPQ
jgi:hypothetical protein